MMASHGIWQGSLDQSLSMLGNYFPPEGQLKLEAFGNGESHSARAISGRALNILSMMEDLSVGKRSVFYLY